MDDVQSREVAWYRQHGRYAERIRRDGRGYEYVIGDWSWERHYPRQPEPIEDKMRRAGVYLDPTSKACGRCHAVKPLDDFYTKKNGRPMWQCKACSKEAASRWQKEHPKRRLRLAS